MKINETLCTDNVYKGSNRESNAFKCISKNNDDGKSMSKEQKELQDQELQDQEQQEQKEQRQQILQQKKKRPQQ